MSDAGPDAHTPAGTDAGTDAHTDARTAPASASAERIATDRIATDRISTDRIATDRIATDRIATDRISTDRIVTVPNAISLARLLGVPLFLYLLLGPHADLAAFFVLVAAGVSDWADGVLARRLNQYSRLGELLDPAADRLYILATLIGLVLRDIIPWWLAAVIVGRDLVLAVALGVLRRYGYGPLPVHYLGKAATFNLLYAFPFLLLASRGGVVADVARPVAWAFTLWGTALYVWAGGVYLLHVAQLVRSVRRGGPVRDAVA